MPTRYTGIQALGWIAGAGMIIAIALNFLLLPGLLTVLRPRGEPEAIGFRRAAPLDRWLIEKRRWVIVAATVLAIGCIALSPGIAFDFDPLNLKDPKSESVSTARDLMNDPMTTPYTAEILAPSLQDAEALAERVHMCPDDSEVPLDGITTQAHWPPLVTPYGEPARFASGLLPLPPSSPHARARRARAWLRQRPRARRFLVPRDGCCPHSSCVATDRCPPCGRTLPLHA